MTTNSLKLGALRIPWMFFWGVIITIICYGWGGAALLLASILIIFFGPEKVTWIIKNEK
ncbi:MAG: hypothetical protein ACTSWN_10690 [Promethearchaeota archaeon]